MTNPRLSLTVVSVYALCVLAAIIGVMVAAARQQIFRCNWRTAFLLRRIALSTEYFFWLLWVVVMVPFHFPFDGSQITTMATSFSTGISVAVLSIFEPFRFRDLEIVARNSFAHALISKWNGKRSLGKRFREICSNLRLHVLALVCAYIPSAASTWDHDLIQSSNLYVPLQLTTTDVAYVGAMLNCNFWKMICGYEIFLYDTGTLQNFLLENLPLTDATRTDLLPFFSQLLALLDRGPFGELFQRYFDELQALRARMANEGDAPTSTRVVLKWLSENEDLGSQMLWPSNPQTFTARVADRHRGCPDNIGYRAELVALSAVNGDPKVLKAKFESMVAEGSMITVLLLFGLAKADYECARKTREDGAGLRFVHIVEECVRYLVVTKHANFEGLFAMLYWESPSEIQAIFTLIYLRMGASGIRSWQMDVGGAGNV